jgi:hypothetical protein
LINSATPAETGRLAMKVRRALILMALPVIAGVGLFASSSPALAAGHGTAGTYQVFVGGKPFGTWVLHRGGGVAPYDAATWSIHKNVVTVFSLIPPVPPPATCLHYGQTWPCQLGVTFTGRKTAGGIASPSAPGRYTENINRTVVIYSSTFYAVRTGDA